MIISHDRHSVCLSLFPMGYFCQKIEVNACFQQKDNKLRSCDHKCGLGAACPKCCHVIVRGAGSGHSELDHKYLYFWSQGGGIHPKSRTTSISQTFSWKLTLFTVFHSTILSQQTIQDLFR